VAAPPALVPLKAGILFGRILPSQPRQDDYQRHLSRVMESGFALFVI
jgi:hypothetical protein